MAAIWKRRSSLRRLSRLNGYCHAALGIALRRPWPKAEKVIASFLGIRAQQIWPSRYSVDGTPKTGLRSRPAIAERARHLRTKRAA